MFSEKKFVVAVSGGVDSVVLLDMLMGKKPDDVEYIVAHFDHGIRKNSQEDEKFVRDLARKYKTKFISAQGNLGKDASEAEARAARYSFLREVKDKYKAEKIITAHHQDDVIETMVINILRGTSPRGLMPMTSYSDILRPLLNRTKAELIKYAEDNKLQWREDETNEDEKYLRNYVRKNIMPKLSSRRDDLLGIRSELEELYTDIDMRTLALLPAKNIMYRPDFVVKSFAVQKEIVYRWLSANGVTNIDNALVERIVIAMKTLPQNKQVDVKDGLAIKSQKRNLLLTSR